MPSHFTDEPTIVATSAFSLFLILTAQEQSVNQPTSSPERQPPGRGRQPSQERSIQHGLLCSTTVLWRLLSALSPALSSSLRAYKPSSFLRHTGAVRSKQSLKCWLVYHKIRPNSLKASGSSSLLRLERRGTTVSHLREGSKVWLAAEAGKDWNLVWQYFSTWRACRMMLPFDRTKQFQPRIWPLLFTQRPPPTTLSCARLIQVRP
jgi:hypothetical protein